VGTGPFKFVSYQPDVGLKTVKNPDYWAKDASGNKLPYLDALNILVIVDPTTRSAFMQSGQGDMVHVYSGKDAADYKALGLTVIAPLNGTIALVPDTANAGSPWANQRVREAVEYAIDREAIAKGLGYGQWIAPYQTPGRDSPLYDPNLTIIRKYDVAKAKQLLTEAGYPSGFKTTILCFAGGLNRDAANTLQAYLIKAGIQAELDIPELGKIIATSMSGWQNQALLWPVLTYGNFNTGMNNFSPTGPNYKSWLRTPEFTQAFKASLDSPTADIKLARTVVSIFAKDASVIPVYETGGGSGFKPYVKNGGWGERGMESFINYEQIWLDK
jgi:ABC-type transport system substrate-binding protein